MLNVQMYKQCFVACLDILGFKNFINEHENDATTINKSINQLKKLSEIYTGTRLSNRDPRIHFLLMSDTLLLFSESDDEKSFRYITGITAELICDGIGLSITNIATSYTPMRFRGAISWGNFYYDASENIFFGPALNEATDWEKKQEWIGALLTPNCADFIRKKSYQSEFLVEYEAPIKEIILRDDRCETVIKPQKHLCVNWTTAFACENAQLHELEETFLHGKNIEFKSKLENTQQFYRYCKTNVK